MMGKELGVNKYWVEFCTKHMKTIFMPKLVWETPCLA